MAGREETVRARMNEATNDPPFMHWVDDVVSLERVRHSLVNDNNFDEISRHRRVNEQSSARAVKADGGGGGDLPA